MGLADDQFVRGGYHMFQGVLETFLPEQQVTQKCLKLLLVVEIV